MARGFQAPTERHPAAWSAPGQLRDVAAHGPHDTADHWIATQKMTENEICGSVIVG